MEPNASSARVRATYRRLLRPRTDFVRVASLAALRFPGPSPSAPTSVCADAPGAHPEWLLFRWLFSALELPGPAIEKTWKALLRGIDLQEALNARARARRMAAQPGPSHEEMRNPHFQETARVLGPLLRRGPTGGPVALWSGHVDVSAFAQLHGYSTVESTPAGRGLARLELYRDARAVAPLWKAITLEFLQRNPEGELHVFLRARRPPASLERRRPPALDPHHPLRTTVWHAVSDASVAELVGSAQGNRGVFL